MSGSYTYFCYKHNIMRWSNVKMPTCCSQCEAELGIYTRVLSGDEVSMSKMVYVIGSLRNPKVPIVAEKIRSGCSLAVFDGWYSAGPDADDYWMEHSKFKGQNYKQALADHAAQHVFNFDKKFLDLSDIAVLVLPAGKSGHIELGYMAGLGKKTFILFDEIPERYDVMYNFATGICFDVEELVAEINKVK